MKDGSIWQMQEAKARLSEVVRQALNSGPQTITVRGQTPVMVLSQTEYEKLTRPKTGLWELLQKSPLKGLQLDIARRPGRNRSVEL